MIRQQAISKVLWGTDESEVYQWLSDKGVSDEDAEKIYADALKVRVEQIRRKAVTMIVACSIGTIVGLGLVAYSFTLDSTLRGAGKVGFVIAIPCIIWLIINVMRLMTGQRDGPVQ